MFAAQVFPEAFQQRPSTTAALAQIRESFQNCETTWDRRTCLFSGTRIQLVGDGKVGNEIKNHVLDHDPISQEPY